MRFLFAFLISISALAENRTVKFEGRVRQGGSPNYIQRFMLLVNESSQELGISAFVRPGMIERRARIMYLEVTGPIDQVDAFKRRLETEPGVSKIKKMSEETARVPDENFKEGVTRKFKVIGTGKRLGSLLDAIKKTAGQSNVTFLDAIPNVGGSTRFVTIQVKGQNSNLDNFHSSLLGARGIADVEAIPPEEKK